MANGLMAKGRLSPATGLLLVGMALASTGCTSQGPYLGPFAVPIPISPYFQDEEEDQFWEKERYGRVPILGPISANGPRTAWDPPSDDEIMRALEHARPIEGGLPFLHEMQRLNVRITKELISDEVDEPRHMPLVGPVQLHHAHYKCSIYFTEVTRIGWPVPYTTVDEDTVEVIYIDHNHLHMVGNVDPGPGTGY